MDSGTIEKKLLEYRARKAREERLHHYKNKVTNIFSSYVKGPNNSDLKVFNEESAASLLESDTVQSSESDTERENDSPSFGCSYLRMLFYTLCFVLWAIMYAIFIKLGFGTVYLILSALVGMYVNTRTGVKSNKEVSAYSVFNKDCKSIDGTLKAEQFEQEIRYGILR